MKAIDILGRLVAFDTTSRGSNLALIEYVEGDLARLGVASTRVPNADGRKSNLFATITSVIATTHDTYTNMNASTPSMVRMANPCA